MKAKELITVLEKYIKDYPEGAKEHIALMNTVSISFAEDIIKANHFGTQVYALKPVVKYNNYPKTKVLTFKGE